MYADNFKINPNENDTIFSWYVRNDADKDNLPVIVWLNGGPGASSLEGLFVEKIGPFYMDWDSGKFYENPNSWSQFANLVFVDNPVGVGFSYTEKDYVRTEDEMGKDFYLFLQQFLKKYNLESNPFYIAGESYAGKYIPYIARTIQNKNKLIANKNKYMKRIKLSKNSEFKINLQGIFMGNGWYYPKVQYESVLEYANYMKFIDEETSNNYSTKYQQCFGYINRNELLSAYKWCEPLEANLYTLIGKFGYDTYFTEDIFSKAGKYLKTYLNSPIVKIALGTTHTWTSSDESGKVADNLAQDVEINITWLLDQLIDSGLELTMYNGMRDGTSCNYMGHDNIINHELKADNAKELSKMDFNDIIFKGSKIGQRKNYENYTYLRIEDTGHFVPLMQSEFMQAYIKSRVEASKNDSITYKKSKEKIEE